MATRELASRTAIVTGASRNIGRAIAVALGEEGASVLVHAAGDRDAVQETAAAVERAGGRAEVFVADLADPENAERIVKAAEDAFGGLDILVNNAAIRPESPIDDLTYEEWRRVMAICLDGAFLMAKAALKGLRKSDAGSICNIGGLTAHTGAADRAHVISAKAGILGLTKALAHDLSPHGITVNCVSPGLIETKRVGTGGKAPAHHDTRTNLVGRRGLPDEVADAVRYLCGPRARYITGETLQVNGGAYLS